MTTIAAEPEVHHDRTALQAIFEVVRKDVYVDGAQQMSADRRAGRI